MTKPLDFLRAQVSPTPGALHLNNAGVSVMTQAASDAIADAARLMAAEGLNGIYPLLERYQARRASFARLVGVQPRQVAMMQTCAAALSQVAFGMPLETGDEVVTWDQEYPSNAYPWHHAARRAGATVKLVPSNADFSLDSGRLIEAIGPRTKVVAVSWVQFSTGAMTDLAAVSAACKAVGAWLVVDAIQGLGVIPFDMAALGVDAVAGGGHKWSLGPMGHGWLALAEHRIAELTPILHGAFTYGTSEEPTDPGRAPHPDAVRFEPGSPLFLSAEGAGASIDVLLETGIDVVHAEATRLAARLREGVLDQGATVLSPSGAGQVSPIVTFVPRGDLDASANALKDAQTTFATRAGGIRLSPHAYNTDDDIDRVLAVLQRAQG